MTLEFIVEMQIKNYRTKFVGGSKINNLFYAYDLLVLKIVINCLLPPSSKIFLNQFPLYFFFLVNSIML